MKTILAIVLTFGITAAHAEAVVQKVCHEDAKTKQEVCKTIKTHKKVEGTVVPDAPAKKSKKK
jgi:hypothetical protein